MKELVQEGFIKENIDLSNRSTADTNTTAANTNTSDEGIGDSISNFFSSLFGDDEETAANYTNAAYDADAILTVHADSEERARQAAEILDRHGAIDVDERNSQYRQQNLTGSSDTTTGETTNMTQNRTNLDNETAIPVIEEELQVGKRAVERGGARIRSRIIEKPVEASVRLREEHVVVNRRPVNRAVTEADMNNFREGEIELTEHAEVPVVGKQARVVEEVEVGKTVEEHDQTIRDTVRRTDVDVQEIDTDTDTDDVSHTGTRTAQS
jgi:uncharacterized protein (TIGR02271 family)